MELGVMLSNRNQAEKKSTTHSHLYAGSKTVDLTPVRKLNRLVLQNRTVIGGWRQQRWAAERESNDH